MTLRASRYWVAGCALTAAAISGSSSAQVQIRDAARPSAMTGRASVSGTVVSDDASRTPLRRVTMTLSRSSIADARVTVTDDRGRYLFHSLPADTYVLTASKGGYVPSSYGAMRLGLPGSPIPLQEGQAFVATPMLLTRGAVIAGRLTNRKGQPVADVPVEVTQVTVVNGDHRPRTFPGSRGTSRTDRRGEYRIFGLAPGDFVVSSQVRILSLDIAREMSPQEIQWALQQTRPGAPLAPGDAGPLGGKHMANAPTYYPGTALAEQAVTIPLGRGEERTGIDFSVQYSPIARVSGVVVGADGQPVAGARVIVAPRVIRPLSFRPFIPDATSLADGTFSVGGVPPGDFVLDVQTASATAASRMTAQVRAGLVAPPAPLASQTTLWGRADVVVSGDNVENVKIVLRPGMTVSGKVVFDGTTLQPPADPTRVVPRLQTLPNAPVNTFATPANGIAVDGTFEIKDVVPGTYSVLASVPPAAGATAQWSLRSATLAGRNVLDVPFEVRPDENLAGLTITFTDRVTELSGTLVDAANRPTPQFFVFVYAVDRGLWTPNSRWIKAVRAGVDGSFKVTGLPAGAYFLCALTDLDATEQYEPAFLEQLVPASIKITLTEGQKLTQPLKVG